MTILHVFIISTAITVGADRVPSSNTQEAIKAVGKATYKQTGIDKRVKKLEKKYIPEQLREYGGWITMIIKVSSERKITYEWTF